MNDLTNMQYWPGILTSGANAMPIPTDQLFTLLQGRVEEMRKTYNHLCDAHAHLSPADDVLKALIEKWARKMWGTLEGHGAEFELYYKHRVLKSRNIVAPKNIADVAIGTNETFARAVQSKSTVQGKRSAIDDYLAAALEQLAGYGGEQPRAKDRCYIQVKIWDQANPWPYDAHTHIRPTVDAFLTQVKNAVQSAINTRVGLKLQMQTLWGPPSPMVAFMDRFKPPRTMSTPIVELRYTDRPRMTPEFLQIKSETEGDQVLIPTLVVKLLWPFGFLCSNGCVMKLSVIGRRVDLPTARFEFYVVKQEVQQPTQTDVTTQNAQSSSYVDVKAESMDF